MPRPQPPLAPAPMLPLVAAVLVIWHLALAGDYLNARFVWDPSLPTLTGLWVLTPLWVDVAWGMAVWLGLAGALFVAARDDAGVLLLFAAGVAALAAGFGDMRAGGTDAALGLPRLAVWAVLTLVPLAGWVYARARHASGHLT